MNKVARYQGLVRGAMTREPGYMYLDEDGLYISDELRKLHRFPAGDQLEKDIKEASDKSDLELRISMLEDKVKALSKTNTEPIEAEAGTPISASDPSKDYVIAGESNAIASMNAKSIEMKGFEYELPEGQSTASNQNNALLINASEDVDISGSSLSMHQQTSSNLVKVTNATSMTVKDTNFEGKTYNTIMTGQNSDQFLKYFIIENCDFNEECKHINIWMSGHQDNAVLDIKNCHFKTAEQTLCISDYHNAPGNSLIVNLENIVIDNYEKGEGDIYEGFIILDSRKAYGENDFDSFKEAAPFKNVTINIKNVTAGGVQLTAENFKMGTGSTGQMLYMYVGTKNYTGDRFIPFNEETKEFFPKIIFK